MADAATTAPNRPELASFLRSRRERVTPEMVGLRFNGRRRTPGLRREELAMLAGISVDYLTRLEQGRETNPSSSVLNALADALQMSGEERKHLGALNMQDRCDPAVCETDITSAVDVDTLALLDRFNGSAVAIFDALTDVLARNDTFQRLYAATGMVNGDPPNQVRYTFLHPLAREVLADWEAIAQGQVAYLRSRIVRYHSSTAVAGFVRDLQEQSPHFARLWDAHDVACTNSSIDQLVHPEVGQLRLRFKSLPLPDYPGTQLVIQWPADDASAVAFEQLTAVPAPTYS